MPRAIATFFVLFCATVAAQAQFADVSSAGGPVTINAAWRFHTGDDPAWAQPNFDDSQWQLLRLDRTWADQGHKGYYGYAWYRISVKLPATSKPLALGFTELVSANEVYADGQLIGGIGKMRPAPVWLAYSTTIDSFPLPVALNGKTITLAIRVWQPKESANNSPFVGRTSNPSVGALPIVNRLSQLTGLQYFISLLPDGIVSAVAAVIGLFSIGLFLLRRRSTEYAWAALFLFSDTAATVGGWCYHIFSWPALDWILAVNCIVAATEIFWILFIWSFLRAPADWLLRTGIVLLILAPLPSAIAVSGYLDITSADLAWIIIPLAIGALVCVRLIRLAFGGSREAQLLLLPFLLSNVVTSFMQTLRYLYYARAINTTPLTDIYRGPLFSVSWSSLCALLSYVAVAVLLMLRFTHSAERDERLSAEMDAAHRVQDQLVPAQLPPTPNFKLDAVYAAAGEVGGDFYQVFPQSDGGVLVAIGDVSGKGLKAAMTGTLALGALRTLAQENLSPAQILARLNDQLAASTDGGFVTCCVAHLNQDGILNLANAGHLSPYRNGEELKTEAGFPLGVLSGVAYSEVSVSLKPGDKLTFMSDGVVEARSAAGELFGFERTAALSTESAEQIAHAAQQFGQEDDITVLTLTLAAAPAPAFAPIGVLHA